MSDDRATALRKLDAMFDRVERYWYQVGFEFVIKIAERLVEKTGGFGLQIPTTAYIPTGQLRGGYRFANAPLGQATKWKSDRRSDYGKETVEWLRADMAASLGGKLRTFYIVNEMAYAYLVENGLEAHAAFPRPATRQVSPFSTQANALKEAIASVGSR